MKAMDYVLMVGILLLAGVMLIYNVVNFGAPISESAQVIISIDGETYGTYLLKEDAIITLGEATDDHYNQVQIVDQGVSMITANCQDQICVKTRTITKAGQSIVCLPHRVMVEIDNSGSLEESEVDDISR